MRIYKMCMTYIKKYKMPIMLLIFISVLSNSVTIISPFIIGNFIDMLVDNPSLDDILRFCLIFASLNFFRIISGYTTAKIYTKIQTHMGYGFNSDLIQHTQRLPISYFHKKDLVFLSQIENTDTNKLIIFCITSIQNLLINLLYLIATTIIILSLNLFASVAIIVFLGLYIISYCLFRKPLYNISREFSETQATFFSKSYEQFRYIKYIKSNSIYLDFKAELDKSFKKLFDTAMKSQKINYYFSSSDNIIVMLMQISLFIIGGIQIIEGSFTIGMFTIFMSYFSIMINSVKFFFNFGKTYQDALVSYDRIQNILSQQPQHNGIEKLHNINSIEIENLFFKYEENERSVLNKLNINFTKGNIYGITGANGSGKSTLMDIILGLYIDEFDGSIKFNNNDIKDLDMDFLRQTHIKVSLQEPTLLNENIAYNIGLKHELTGEELAKIKVLTKTVGLDKYINKLDNGLDTVISAFNNNISGGEKQKISILKVLFSNSDLMIFDEPTSALDINSIKLFKEHLNSIKKDKIIIIISHSEMIIDLFDTIYPLSK